MLPDWCGKSSLKECTSADADIIIKSLVNTAKVVPNNFGFRTEKQYRTIMHFASKLSLDKDRINGFIRHTTKSKSNPDELSIREASDVIIGLKKIVTLKNSKVKVNVTK